MASEQHLLDKVRPPRVQITYDVEIGDAIQEVEIPFVVGVLADLAGTPSTPLAPLKNRKFIEVDRDNINDVMASLNAQLPLRVKDVIGGKNPFLDVLLTFKSMDDLEPGNIVKEVPEMRALFSQRELLKDLLTKLDGNEALDTDLMTIATDPDVLGELQKSLGTTSSN